MCCRTQRLRPVYVGVMWTVIERLICDIVLRMLSVYVGEEKFLKGVSIYLKKHLYANSVAEDLWAGIQEATSMSAFGLCRTG